MRPLSNIPQWNRWNVFTLGVRPMKTHFLRITRSSAVTNLTLVCMKSRISYKVKM